jgi:hypothetical protein
MAVRLRAQLQLMLASGLSSDPLEHAEQFAGVASILHDAFNKAGLRSTVVGGSAIEIHAPGVYRSGDMDLVVERLRFEATHIGVVFESLGFERRGRHWRMGDLFVEVPSTTLSDPSELMRVGNFLFEIVKKEVVLADRIIGYRQWGTLAYGQQAISPSGMTSTRIGYGRSSFGKVPSMRWSPCGSSRRPMNRSTKRFSRSCSRGLETALSDLRELDPCGGAVIFRRRINIQSTRRYERQRSTRSERGLGQAATTDTAVAGTNGHHRHAAPSP